MNIIKLEKADVIVRKKLESRDNWSMLQLVVLYLKVYRRLERKERFLKALKHFKYLFKPLKKKENMKKLLSLAILVALTLPVLSQQTATVQPKETVASLLPANQKIPAIAPVMSCSKTLYGNDLWTFYSTCSQAENGAASWLSAKTDVIAESVTTSEYQSPDPGCTLWSVTITYSRSKCY